MWFKREETIHVQIRGCVGRDQIARKRRMRCRVRTSRGATLSNPKGHKLEASRDLRRPEWARNEVGRDQLARKRRLRCPARSSRGATNEGFGFRVSGFGLRISGFGFRASGFWFRVSGFGLRISGFGFRVSPDREKAKVAVPCSIISRSGIASNRLFRSSAQRESSLLAAYWSESTLSS